MAGSIRHHSLAVLVLPVALAIRAPPVTPASFVRRLRLGERAAFGLAHLLPPSAFLPRVLRVLLS